MHQLVMKLMMVTGTGSHLDNGLPGGRGSFLEHVDDTLAFCGDLERLL